MNLFDQIQKRGAINELNGFALGKSCGVVRVVAEADDLDAVDPMVAGESPHLANDRDADLLASPLLALHQLATAVLAQDEVDTTVSAA